MMDNIYPNGAEKIFNSHFKRYKKLKLYVLIWLSLSGYVKDDMILY